MKLLTRKKIKADRKLKVVISDSAYIRGLSQSQIDKIEEDLTFKNPKYDNVMKYSKWATTKEPKFLNYCEHIEAMGVDIYKVPLGYFNPKNFNIPQDKIKDCRDYEEIEYPPFRLNLRATQIEAVENYLEHNKSETFSHYSSAIWLPTGKGKTIIGINLAHRLKARTLVVVHKEDLVKGWVADIKKCYGDTVDIGIIKAKQRRVGEHFTVATIQTLNNLDSKTLEALYTTFGFVILDECHHVPSTTFSLVNNFKSRYRLGLSATPERNDGLTHIINLYFGSFCYKYKAPVEGEKDILPFKVFRREVPTIYDPICRKKGNSYSVINFERKENFTYVTKLKSDEYRISDISYDKRPTASFASIDRAVLLNRDTSNFILNDIVSEYKSGHSCLVLFKQVDVLLDYFRLLITERKIDREDIGLYYGGNAKCDEVKEKAENQRKYITLATYSKAAEGTNVQQWEIAFLVSSLNNGKDTEQTVGRIRRVKEYGEKLDEAIVYDYRYPNAYALSHHGHTRDKRYREMSTTIGKTKSKFSRGF